MISGQSRGKLDNVPAGRVKSMMITYLTSKFGENYNRCFEINDNQSWFNDILRVDLSLNSDKHAIELTYKDNYIYQSGKLIIENPIIFKSAYSENMRNIISFLKKGKTSKYQDYPFDRITNYDDYESTEVNSIKMGFSSIERTIDFVTKLTCEPPFGSYIKGTIFASDYIMYEGDIKVVRTYNIPDLNIITQDIGPMPNEIFPSDHIPYIADFIIE
jgi:hypothetical protein